MAVSGRTHNTAHALCMLNNWGWGHTLRISNIYCFSKATTVMRMRFSVTSCVRCLCYWNFLCLIRWLHPDLFCNFTDLHFGLFIKRVCVCVCVFVCVCVWKNDIFTNRKFLLDHIQNVFDWIQFKIMCRNHSAQKPLYLSNQSTFIQSVVCSCSHPVTSHFSAAQIQTCIPTFQPQPNTFVKECAVF